jgi:hypothetical protein
MKRRSSTTEKILFNLIPIQIPHQYLKKEDIEIAGFLSANNSLG